jgi:Spy/CpxP family protein refolding chaperone
MTNTLLGRVLAVALLLAPAAQAYAQSSRATPFGISPSGAFPWWKMEESRKELGLTADQTVRIDHIWETTRPELRQEWEELTRLEDKLSRLIQNDANEAVLSRQIDRVETARANGNKTRSLMLVQMMKVLTPAQRTRLAAMHQRYQPQPQKQTPAPNQQKRD